MNKNGSLFSRFCKMPVEIYRIKNASSYSKKAETERVCSVFADIQPCGGELSEEAFGFAVNRRFKMYCARREDIREGDYAGFGGEVYRVISVEQWDMGTIAVLDLTEGVDLIND